MFNRDSRERISRSVKRTEQSVTPQHHERWRRSSPTPVERVITGIAVSEAPAAEELPGSQADPPELIEHRFYFVARELRDLDPPEEDKRVRKAVYDEEGEADRKECWNSLQQDMEIGDRIKVLRENDGTYTLIYKECE